MKGGGRPALAREKQERPHHAHAKGHSAQRHDGAPKQAPAQVGRGASYASTLLMHAAQFTFDANVWRHPGDAAWHFVTIPSEISDEIQARTGGDGRAFGTVPVTVRLGETEWSTSLFADTHRDAYLMPIKAQIRRKERLVDGDAARLTIIIDDAR